MSGYSPKIYRPTKSGLRRICLLMCLLKTVFNPLEISRDAGQFFPSFEQSQNTNWTACFFLLVLFIMDKNEQTK